MKRIILYTLIYGGLLLIIGSAVYLMSLIHPVLGVLVSGAVMFLAGMFLLSIFESEKEL